MTPRFDRTLRRLAVPALALAAAAALAGPLDDFEAAMGRGDCERASRIADRLVTQNPQSSVAAYHLACALGCAGELDRAMEHLARCAELGYSGVRTFERDAELDPLRSHDGFARVMDRVRANAEARVAEFRAMTEEATPTVRLPPRHDATKPMPLVIALHGSGGNGANTAAAWARAAKDVGAILVAPDALRPLRGTRGYSWTFRDEAEWYVLELIEEARQKWAIGPIVLVGFSQGANIAFAMGQEHPGLFVGVVPVCGHYEADVAAIPADGARPRWCLLTGARDPQAHTYEAAERAFEEAGMVVHRHAIPGMGHALPRGAKGGRALSEALAWALTGEAP